MSKEVYIRDRLVEVDDETVEGGIENYLVDMTLHYTIDEDYGADADGNRGEYREWLDLVEIEHVTTTEGVPVELTPELKEKIKQKIDE